MVLGFSGTQAAKIVGISYRQLDYWARTDLIRPTAADASGSGSRRVYSYRDLLELRVIKNLLDAGIRLESVREVFTYLRNHVDTDIVAAHIVISGQSVVLCQGDQLVDVLRNTETEVDILFATARSGLPSPAIVCSLKSQCALRPADSTTRRSVSSPQRPRAWFELRTLRS